VIDPDRHLQIGSLLFEGLDQIDLTGPFEVLSRIPNSTYRIYGKTAATVRDLKGLRITPDAALADAPSLDVLHVPGGFGQEALMEDAKVLDWIRQQAAGAHSVFSVCTGALLCGAAGLLKGRRATTHWASYHLLPFFGAIPVDERVVVDGNWVFAAGVTAGIDGALRLAAGLRGESAAQAIQLHMVYAPEPPFNSGTPETAPVAILEQARRSVADVTARREATARRVAARLGIAVPSGSNHHPTPTNARSEQPMDLTHIHAFTAAMQRKDLDTMLEHMADDVTLNTPLAAEPVKGKAAIRPVVQALLGVVEAFDFREIMQGPRHVSAFFGITIGSTELDGVDYWRLDQAGLIQEMTVLWRPLPAVVEVQRKLAGVNGGPT